MAWDAAKKKAYNKRYYQMHKDYWQQYNEGKMPKKPTNASRLSNAMQNPRQVTRENEALSNVSKKVKEGLNKYANSPLGREARSIGEQIYDTTHNNVGVEREAKRIRNNPSKYTQAEHYRQLQRHREQLRESKMTPYERARQSRIENSKYDAMRKASEGRGRASAGVMTDRATSNRLRMEEASRRGSERSKYLRSLNGGAVEQWRRGARDLASNWKSGAKSIGQDFSSNWRSGAKSVKNISRKIAADWKSGVKDLPRYAKSAAAKGKNIIDRIKKHFS